MKKGLLLLSVWAITGCLVAGELSHLSVPAGFEISVFARNVSNARGMAWGDKGTLFVGSREEGSVFALRDEDKDGYAEINWQIAEALAMPVGVAFKDGDLYVSAVSSILKFENVEDTLANPPKAEIIYQGYPDESWHGWKYLRFGQGDWLYAAVGAPCNVCLSEDPVFATMTRLDVKTKRREIVASGIRNSVGFDFDPVDGKLWFTDNNRDMMGDDMPACELNRLDVAGQHFGFPFCHEGVVLDPEYGKGKKCEDYVKPQIRFQAHTAPLGMTFYRGKSFPKEYHGDIFVAQHGSWNRSKKVGYRVLQVKIEEGRATKSMPFVEGFVQRWDKAGKSVEVDYPGGNAAKGWEKVFKEKVMGRPVDVINTPEGDLLISDDMADMIYRIHWKGGDN